MSPYNPNNIKIRESVIKNMFKHDLDRFGWVYIGPYTYILFLFYLVQVPGDYD